MIAAPCIDDILRGMKKRQRETADQERHLRAAQAYVDLKLRKALTGIEIDSIDFDVTSVSCTIEVWLETRELLNKTLDAIDKGPGKWHLGPAGFCYRNTFQYCKSALKGMITVSVYWVLAKPEDPHVAAMPQNEESR